MAFILAVALIVAAFFVLATAAHAQGNCHFIDLDKLSEETVEETRESLQAQGWVSDSPDSGEFLYSPQCAAQGESEALLEEVQALRLEIAELRQNIEDLTTIVQAFVEMFVSPASGV